MDEVRENFYQNLNKYYGSIHEVMSRKRDYEDVPDSWNIIVTDVENSTQAVKNGDQQMVHLAATGSIVACLNIAREQDMEIPFFFGGDGATLLIPDTILKSCLFALRLHQERCELSFDFHLRVGYRKVGAMYKKGAVLKILKYKRNDLHIMPIIIGNALQMAEREIKNFPDQDDSVEAMAYNLNLEGMECKWDKIKPPRDQQEVLSLIITAQKVDEQFELYSNILEQIELIYGDDTKRHPVTAKRLKMVNHLSRIKKEVKMKYKKVTGKEVTVSWIRALFGKFFVKHSSTGKSYVQDMIQLTETLLIDGAINTVITGTVKQRKQLLTYLDELEAAGSINYGYYSSKTSVLSCFVTAIDDYHVHFLDGEDGGYTQASKILKAKLRP
jgi:hypothetical protein